MRFYLISDNTDTQTGMRLAGIEGVVAHQADEVTAALDYALTQPDVGMILVTEKIADDFEAIVNEAKQAPDAPLILAIPDRHGSALGKDRITRYVREAIGVKI